jgi:DNA-binding NarL/FixJ family response regulator
MHSILIVEDETMVAAELKERLSECGYEVLGPCGRAEVAIKTDLSKNNHRGN